MKFYVAFIVLLIGVALAQDSIDIGPPDCSNELVLNVKVPNPKDATTYWVCLVVGEDPKLEKCAAGTIFNVYSQSCFKPNNLPSLG